MKRIFTAIFLICSLLAFTGCGGGGMKSKAGHLNLALWWFGETLDPAHGWDGWTLTRIGAGETLVAVNEHMEFVPQLADKWEHINATTWRFHIRPNVKFQDGTPMTPELVKASIERTLQENDRAKKALHAKEIRVDGENIVIETEAPNASLISALSDPLFIIVNTQADMSKVASTPVLTGPYTITGWTKGSEIQMKRNEHYWDGKPGLDTVTVKLFEDDTSRAMALQSGEIDLMQRMTEANRSLFADKPDYTIYETTGVRVFMVTPYQGDGIFTDKNLRKALAYMLDNDALCDRAQGCYIFCDPSNSYLTVDVVGTCPGRADYWDSDGVFRFDIDFWEIVDGCLGGLLDLLDHPGGGGTRQPLTTSEVDEGDDEGGR